MRPAVVALSLALFLFSFVYRLPPLLFYVSLLVSVTLLVYGLFTEDLPVEPFEDEENGGGGPDPSGDNPPLRK
jgi:hypothetical protein